jgi:hypothetical protein
VGGVEVRPSCAKGFDVVFSLSRHFPREGKLFVDALEFGS